MEVSELAAYDVGETNRAGEARRGAMVLARQAGLDEVEIGKVGIVVTEALTNMVKHAEGGRLLVQPLREGGARGIEALALDRGPGMSRLTEMMRDGFSTRGTAGNGLGAIERQSTSFDVYSTPGRGTAVLMRVWANGRNPATRDFAIGGVSVPLPGETSCGDGWAAEEREGRATLLVVDGLGHGPLAHAAATTAIATFRAHAHAAPAEIVKFLHGALRSTRGCAGCLVRVDARRERVDYCGVGNMEERIISADRERRLVSQFGTLGHDLRKIGGFEYPFPPGATLVVHSDGVGRQWSLADYPGLAERHPALVAGVLYRDHQRGRDDATVVVLRRAA